jgi:hypothetical protein
MYKVRTDQIDVSFSRLQTHSDLITRNCPNGKATTRTALPSSRPQQPQRPVTRPHASQHLNPLSTPYLPASPSRPNYLLASPSKRSLTAPVLPSIIEGEVSFQARCESGPLGDRDRDRDRNPKSNVVEGRAADGLLSLKGVI